MLRDLVIGVVVAAAVVMPTAFAHSETIRPVATEVPAGEYRLDSSHASLIFRVNHLGFSHFTSQFRKFDATLSLDPKHPEQSSVTATIDPRSIEIVNSKLAVDIQGPQWFDSLKFPQMTFRSTKVELTGPNTAHITGDLSLHGMTIPVTWDATFNGGYAANPYDPGGARAGFSAHGVLKRSAFGMGYGIPAPGTTMGVSDDVDFTIEAEFSHPAPTPAKQVKP